MSQPDPIAPDSNEELCDFMRAAVADRSPIEVVGAGTKRCIGHPAREVRQVSTRAFASVIDYDPAELVITVGAGLPLVQMEALLAAQGQMLAFEPFDFADLTGEAAGRSTIGGVVAAGFAGSRRVSAGSVRDHLLGFTAVSGNAEIFKAGGRVVKNVTGFDLSKLMAGSWGQLAVFTQLTLKVLPQPRLSLTLHIAGLDDARAIGVLIRAMRSQCSVAAATYIPEGALQSDEGTSRTLLRLEGFGPSVEARARLLREVLERDADVEQLDGHLAHEVWSHVRCATIHGMTVHGMKTQADALWRFCIPAISAVDVIAAIRLMHGKFFVDWGGGLVWACVPITADAATVRSVAERAGGHATLVRAPDAYRLLTPALHPETAGVAALTQRVKAAFDAAGILDPERFARHRP